MARPRWGRIVNIIAIGIIGNAGQANYAAAKAGVIGLTKSTAREFGSRYDWPDAVAPGFIETAMTAVLDEKVRSQMVLQIPAGRPGRPEDGSGGKVPCVGRSFLCHWPGTAVDGGMTMA